MRKILVIFGILGFLASANFAAAGPLLKPTSAFKPASTLSTRTVCIPKTCATLGKNCGSVSDGCGGTLTCGTCSGFETCGGGSVANVCGQACYRYAFLAEDGAGVQNLFDGGNCLEAPKNLTNGSDPDVEVSHLSAGRDEATVGFLQIERADDHSVLNHYANVMSFVRRSWFTLSSGTPPQFTVVAQARDAAGRMALFTRETSGGYALRLNTNVAGAYPPADSQLVQRLGMVPANDMEWVPTTDGTPSRRLIVSFGMTPAVSSLYVLHLNADLHSARIVPLEEAEPGSSPGSAMLGSQPALGQSGQSLILVRNLPGKGMRIVACNLNFSELTDAAPRGRAFCPNAWEPTGLRDLPGDMASPSVFPDNQSLFFAMKRPPSTLDSTPSWELYRARFDRFQIHQLTATDNQDETEIVALKPWVELVAQTTVNYSATPVKEETRYEANTTVQYNTQFIVRCDADDDCASGQECRSGSCVTAD